MQVKSGVKTSEFWLTLITSVVSLLVVGDFIPNSDSQELISLAKDVISGVVASAAIISYIRSRTKVKEELLNVERLMFLVGARDDIKKAVDPSKEPVENIG